MARSLLMVSRRAPWSGLGAREALDIVLAGGAYELPVAMLFMDDGVLQLVKGQAPQLLEQKNLGANLQALPLFGIEALFVCGASLAERGLSAEHLALDARILHASDLAVLFNQYNEVITL